MTGAPLWVHDMPSEESGSRLFGVSDADAAALGSAIRGIEVDGRPAIHSVEAFGSRAGGTFRGRPPLPTSDLDIYVTVRSAVANSAEKLGDVQLAITEIAELFTSVKRITVNPVVELDILAERHKLAFAQTPFLVL